MKLKSFRKIATVGAGNAFNALMGFVFLAVIAKSFDLITFGKYALLTTLLVSISKIIDFGTNSVFVSQINKEKEEDNISSFFSIKIILTIVSLVILSIALLLLKEFNWIIFLILCVGLFAYGINYTFFALFQKEEDYRSLVLLNILSSLPKGICALLIILNSFTPTLVSVLSIFSLSIMFSILLFMSLSPKYRNIRINFKLIPVLFNKSFPGGVSQTVYESWPTLSNTIAKVTGGLSNVGVFSLASKISRLFALLSFSIFTVLLPKNTDRKKNNLSYDFNETFIISSLVFLIATISIPFIHFGVNRFFGDKFSESLSIINILIFSNAFTSIHTFMENYFFVEQKTRYLFIISISKLVIFSLLCVFLVPVYSLAGLAGSDLAASISAFLLTILFIKKVDSVGKI